MTQSHTSPTSLKITTTTPLTKTKFLAIYKNKIILNIVASYIHSLTIDVIKLNQSTSPPTSLEYRVLLVQKYKDIDNAQWMLENDYHNLLFYKLKNNESIYFSTYSVQLMIKDYAHLENYNTIIKKLLNNSSINKIDSLFNDQALITDAACSSNSIALVKYLFNELKYQFNSNTCIDLSIESGNLDILVFLLHDVFIEKANSSKQKQQKQKHEQQQQKYQIKLRSIEITSSRGHVLVLKYLFDHQSDLLLRSNINKSNMGNAVDQAAANGHLNVVYYLLETIGVKSSVAATEKAIQAGHEDVALYLVDRGYYSTNMLQLAASIGSIKLLSKLKLLVLNGGKHFPIECMNSAPNLETILFLHGSVESCSEAAFEKAIQRDDYKCFEFLYTWYSKTLSKSTLNHIFRLICCNCRVDMAEFFQKNNKDFKILSLLHILTHQYEVRRSNINNKNNSKYTILDMFKWLDINEIPSFNSDTFCTAAQLGFIEIMEWLYQQQKPILLDTTDLDRIVKSESLEVIMFIKERYDDVKCTEDGLLYVAERGLHSILDYLLTNYLVLVSPDISYMLTDIFLGGVTSGRIDVLELILEFIRNPPTEDNGFNHQTTDNISTIDYLVCTETMFVGSLEKGYLEMFYYLFDRYSPLISNDLQNRIFETILTRYDEATLMLFYNHFTHFTFNSNVSINLFDSSSLKTIKYFLKRNSNSINTNLKELIVKRIVN